MELVFLQGAEADIQAAFESYGGTEAARADRFLQHLDQLCGLLRANPAMGPSYQRPFRRLLLRGFHHAMFYTVEGRRISRRPCWTCAWTRLTFVGGLV